MIANCEDLCLQLHNVTLGWLLPVYQVYSDTKVPSLESRGVQSQPCHPRSYPYPCLLRACLLCACCVFAAWLLRACCVLAAFLLRACCYLLEHQPGWCSHQGRYEKYTIIPSPLSREGMIVYFSYLPRWAGKEWNIHCHTFPGDVLLGKARIFQC